MHYVPFIIWSKFPIADIDAGLSSPEQCSPIAAKENLHFSKGNNKKQNKTKQNKELKACGWNCETLSYIWKEPKLYTASMSKLASKQPRSQDFSPLPPLVVGRKTLVATFHLGHKLFHRGRVTEYFCRSQPRRKTWLAIISHRYIKPHSNK